MFLFNQLTKGDRSLPVLAGAILAGFLVLLGGLWFVQIISAKKHQANLLSQSSRKVRIPALRGRILDRHHMPLADVRPSYNLVVYLDDLRPGFGRHYTDQVKPEYLFKNPRSEELPAPVVRRLREQGRHAVALTGTNENGTLNVAHLSRQARYEVVSNLLHRVSAALREPRELVEKNFNRHYETRRSLALPLMDDLAPWQVALFEEQADRFGDVELEVQPLRVYPHRNGTLAAHLLGYLKLDDQVDEGEEYSFRYRLRDYVGASGLEAAYDHELRGEAGVKLVQVNSMSYRHSEQMLLEPEPGKNVILTIDLAVQRAMENALEKMGPGRHGAAVVMNVENGDILAMASWPTFNPNYFIKPPTNWNEVWTEQWRDHPLQPLFNRATHGEYEAGSVFKIIVALAGLETGLLDPEETYQSHGEYRVAGRTIKDTAPAGPYDFNKAFIKSSNCYFIDYGLKIKAEKLVEMGRHFGLGERTGLPRQREADGYFPRLEKLRKNDGSRWMDGDTANLSIGHGEILVTPLQMAVMTAAVANGGRILQPRLWLGFEPQTDPAPSAPRPSPPGVVLRNVNVSERSLRILREAMADDVANPEGSGKLARIAGFAVAGKTGTAELPADDKTWFVSYAPAESPRYAVAVEVTGGASGGTTCAPIAKEIYQAILNVERAAAAKIIPPPGAG